MINKIYNGIREVLKNNFFYYKISEIYFKNEYIFVLKVSNKQIFHKFNLKTIVDTKYLMLLNPMDVFIVGVIYYVQSELKINLDCDFLDGLRNASKNIVNDLKVSNIAFDLMNNSFIINKKINFTVSEIFDNYSLMSLLSLNDRFNLGKFMGKQICA